MINRCDSREPTFRDRADRNCFIETLGEAGSQAECFGHRDKASKRVGEKVSPPRSLFHGLMCRIMDATEAGRHRSATIFFRACFTSTMPLQMPRRSRSGCPERLCDSMVNQRHDGVPPHQYYFFFALGAAALRFSSIAAWAAARRATGTRKGEQLT